jgi:hypothetical protein
MAAQSRRRGHSAALAFKLHAKLFLAFARGAKRIVHLGHSAPGALIPPHCARSVASVRHAAARQSRKFALAPLRACRCAPLGPECVDICCKSPKLPGAIFSAVKRRPPIDVATLPRSPASSSLGNEVPHIFTRNWRVYPKEILITSAK